PPPAPRPRTSFGLRLGVVVLAIALLIAGLVYPAVDRVRESAARSHCNLGSISVGLRAYEDHHESLPPAVLRGPDGRPLHSWRVLILPYISEQALYAEFKLDEPWDSAHNIRLLDRMPRLYAAPWTKYVDVPPGHTLLKV